MNKFDDEKFQEILNRIEAIAIELDCVYALPINENADGTADVYGIVIGDVDFIGAIFKSLENSNFDIKKVAGPPEAKPKHTPKKTNNNDDDDNNGSDPTFH